MVPAEKVITCQRGDTIRSLVELLLEHKIGAVVVLEEPSGYPAGIVTKTDILRAYNANLTLEDKVEAIMSRHLATCDETMSRDQAARVLERNKVRYRNGKSGVILRIT